MNQPVIEHGSGKMVGAVNLVRGWPAGRCEVICCAFITRGVAQSLILFYCFVGKYLHPALTKRQTTVEEQIDSKVIPLKLYPFTHFCTLRYLIKITWKLILVLVNAQPQGFADVTLYDGAWDMKPHLAPEGHFIVNKITVSCSQKVRKSYKKKGRPLILEFKTGSEMYNIVR